MNKIFLHLLLILLLSAPSAWAQTNNVDRIQLEKLADDACQCLKDIINPIEDEELLQLIENIAKYGPQQGLEAYRRTLRHLDPGQQQEKWQQVNRQLEPLYKKATGCEEELKKRYGTLYTDSRHPANRKYILDYLKNNETCYKYAGYILK